MVKPTSSEECVPEVIAKTAYKPLNAELLLNFRCPPVPPHGSSNEVLLQWSTQCVALANDCAMSVDKIRGLQP